MVRKGFDLGFRRRTANEGRKEERPASVVSFFLPICAALLIIADVISGSIVTADFFARGEMAWFGVSLATLIVAAPL